MRFPRKRPLYRIVNEEEAEIMKSSKKGIKNTSKFISNTLFPEFNVLFKTELFKQKRVILKKEMRQFCTLTSV